MDLLTAILMERFFSNTQLPDEKFFKIKTMITGALALSSNEKR